MIKSEGNNMGIIKNMGVNGQKTSKKQHKAQK
jgi:hypothetical protein